MTIRGSADSATSSVCLPELASLHRLLSVVVVAAATLYLMGRTQPLVLLLETHHLILHGPEQG